jgi:hypothetical protein
VRTTQPQLCKHMILLNFSSAALGVLSVLSVLFHARARRAIIAPHVVEC